MGDGFAWVGQHLVPVISAQALGHVPHSTHAYDLVMADSVDDRRFSESNLCLKSAVNGLLEPLIL